MTDANGFVVVGEPIVLSEREFQGQTTRKVARLVTVNGRGPYLDVRVHTASEKYTGPTRKGLMLTGPELARLAELAPELVARLA